MNTRQITISSGILEGEEKDQVLIFRGIPYAKPPVGKLRWKAPQPAEPWQGVYDATQFKAMAPQPDMTRDPFYGREFYTDPAYPLPRQSEDCLYLNVWAPAETPEGGCPVAFWIHGGSFDHGFGSEMEFDGEAYARQGVILVTINYRVGVLGFLALPELRDAQTGSVGNYGMLDQLLALQWVHDNIRAFGGNPDNVTVFGQSAGAISGQCILSSPLARGLYHKAILQSAAGYRNDVTHARSLEEAYEAGKAILEQCGAKSVEELYEVPAQKFVDILPDFYHQHPGMRFRPCVDGWYLTETPDEALADGSFARVPVIVGSTSEDIGVPKGRDAQSYKLYEGCYQMAMIRHDPTYVYYFCRHLPGDDAGAFHSSELWYEFGTLKRCWRPFTSEDSLLSRELIGYWTHFFWYGCPSEWGWPACNRDQKVPYIRYIQ